MKNLILIVLAILPFVGLSQRDGSKVMDVNNIDYRLLDSLIIVEVNKVRDSLGNYNMNYSRVISDNVSKNRCEKLKTEQKVYHPSGLMNLYSDKVESSIIDESATNYNFKGGDGVVDGFEICLFKTKSYKLVTYSDYAKSIVDLWRKSPDHFFVVRDAYNRKITDTGKEIFLMSGVSSKYGVYDERNGFYVVLNLSVIYNY